MKRYLIKLCTLVIALVAIIFTFAGCDFEPRAESMEELIPSADQMGVHEGLWLYKGGERMRTDGSEKEDILGDIEIGEAQISAEDFTVRNYKYSTETHKAVFLCRLTGGGDFLYLYDYENKTGKYLCQTPESKGSLYTSKGRFYADFGDAGYLFDNDGNLLCDGIAGTLDSGVLYASVRTDGVTQINWYSDRLHTATVPQLGGDAKIEVCGGYLYYGYETPRCSINIKTEQVTTYNILDVTFDSDRYVDAYRSVKNAFTFNGCKYVFSVVYCIIDEGKSDWYWYLHKFDGANATLECDFGEFRNGATISIFEDKFYISGHKTSNSIFHTYFCYDPSTGEFNKITKAAYHKGKEPNKWYPPETKVLTVGEYEFFTTAHKYGYGAFMGEPIGCLYYLERRHGDITEIMQYGDSYFYDDICTF